MLSLRPSVQGGIILPGAVQAFLESVNLSVIGVESDHYAAMLGHVSSGEAL